MTKRWRVESVIAVLLSIVTAACSSQSGESSFRSAVTHGGNEERFASEATELKPTALFSVTSYTLGDFADGYDKLVHVSPDGHAAFILDDRIGGRKTRTGQMSRHLLESLHEACAGSHFFSLPEELGVMMNDGLVTHITVTDGLRSHTVTAYLGAAEIEDETLRNGTKQDFAVVLNIVHLLQEVVGLTSEGSKD